MPKLRLFFGIPPFKSGFLLKTMKYTPCIHTFNCFFNNLSRDFHSFHPDAFPFCSFNFSKNFPYRRVEKNARRDVLGFIRRHGKNIRFPLRKSTFPPPLLLLLFPFIYTLLSISAPRLSQKRGMWKGDLTLRRARRGKKSPKEKYHFPIPYVKKGITKP